MQNGGITNFVDIVGGLFIVLVIDLLFSASDSKC